MNHKKKLNIIFLVLIYKNCLKSLRCEYLYLRYTFVNVNGSKIKSFFKLKIIKDSL